MRNLVLIILTMIALNGCVTEQSTFTSSNGSSKPSPVVYPYTDIIIFQYPPKDRKFTELGRIQASTVAISSDEVLYRKLQREAAELKANALILAPDGIYQENGYKKAEAVAVDMPISVDERHQILRPTPSAAASGAGEVIY